MLNTPGLNAAVFSETKDSASEDPALEGPVEVAPSAEEQLQTHLKERLEFAKGLYFRRLYDIALEEFKSVYDSSSDADMTREALYGLSETLFSKKMYAEAFQYFRKYEAMLDDGDRKDLVMRRKAECLYFLNRKEEAYNAFKKLVASKNPDVKYASHYFSGKILFESGDIKKSRPFFETLHAADSNANAFRSYSAYYLAEIEADSGNYEKSDVYFQEAFESGAADIQQMAMFGAGKLMFELKNYEPAAEYFMNAYQDGTDKDVGEDALVGYMKALFSSQKYTEVIEAFTSYKDSLKDPENKVTVSLLNARSYEKTNRPEQAHLLFKELFETVEIPSEILASAQMSHIEFLIRNNQANEALSILNEMKSFASIPEDRIAYFKALSLDRTGDFQKAHEAYEAFLTDYSTSDYRDEILLSAAYLYLKEKKYESAIPHLLTYIQQYPDQPMISKVTSDLILTYIKLKQNDEAIEWSGRYMELYQDREGAAEVHARLAALLSDSGQRDKAAEVYEKHLQMFPSHDSAATLLAAGYNQQLAGQHENAIEFYQKIQPDTADEDVYKDSLVNLAFCAVQLNRLDLAAEAYLRILDEFPLHKLEPEIYFWMAEYYSGQGDLPSMKKVLEDFEDHPNFSERKIEWTYYSAELSRLQGDYEGAQEKYRICIDSRELFIGESWMGLGKCSRQQQDYAAAVNYFNQALRSAADNNRLAAQSRMEIGNTLMQQEKFAEAAKAYLAVGILYEDDAIVPQALFDAAQAFKKSGNTERADQILTELKDRYKDFAPMKDITSDFKENAA